MLDVSFQPRPAEDDDGTLEEAAARDEDGRVVFYAFSDAVVFVVVAGSGR